MPFGLDLPRGTELKELLDQEQSIPASTSVPGAIAELSRPATATATSVCTVTAAARDLRGPNNCPAARAAAARHVRHG